ncbi:hypothetical protein TREPR_1877 [Treponema primitia ZAS-2]|uniref:Uncharacterized protein n=1 Tax=Treponema primitia (strain ATCC BAA-887 / DSM 12427 / ZAS-2) TaxID=545694 RepID=F5YL53_TREPZ|nr:hypothetical protein [Treponema primitia]AEF86804.1 hypothetical protein TREPR_1877 [Treponema primitia ZAS-2]
MIEHEIVKAVVSEMKNCFGKDNEHFSKTRDIFATRIQSYTLETGKYLEAAIIGEIGNNTFDHNFVFENNYPRGVYCNLLYREKYIVLADYGKGVKQSLLPVLPSITSDTEAIEIAFTKRISGRSPENRGNGLKFVSENIQQNNWHLYFQSGSGCCSIDNTGLAIYENEIPLLGCLVIIMFNGGK